MQEDAIFPPHIHRTWEVYFSPSLYLSTFCILIPGDSFKFFRGRSGAQDDRYVYEKQRYDGWFNNMAHPEWGSIGETAWDIN